MERAAEHLGQAAGGRKAEADALAGADPGQLAAPESIDLAGMSSRRDLVAYLSERSCRCGVPGG